MEIRQRFEFSIRWRIFNIVDQFSWKDWLYDKIQSFTQSITIYNSKIRDKMLTNVHGVDEFLVLDFIFIRPVSLTDHSLSMFLWWCWMRQSCLCHKLRKGVPVHHQKCKTFCPLPRYHNLQGVGNIRTTYRPIRVRIFSTHLHNLFILYFFMKRIVWLSRPSVQIRKEFRFAVKRQSRGHHKIFFYYRVKTWPYFLHL